MNAEPRDHPVIIVGAGLAGSEAAWQAAEQGVPVVLYEMRPQVQTPAHKTGLFAELVCSNSLKSNLLTAATGVLKEELRRLGSLILRCADESAVPAGQALAVDREVFAEKITRAIEEHPLIEVRREEITTIPDDGPCVIATGPLTSPELSRAIGALSGRSHLYFYDAIAPIVSADSIDYDIVFRASRYDKGEAAYLNCPMTQEQYNAFYDALMAAETTMHADYDPDELFEGCLPIEILASRGREAIRFGPMKPTGLVDPRTRERPYAVVQLRTENKELTMYNLVGFQTSLTYGEQKRVFSMIPGLEHAEFLRYGAVHRNTYVNAPTLLRPTYQFRGRDDLFFAGQITGVEGYVPSTGSGLVAGLNAARLVKGEPLLTLPLDTVMGALSHHITHAAPDSFQPMNANFGLLPPVETATRINKREKRKLQAERALGSLDRFMAERM